MTTNKPNVRRYDNTGCPEQICRVETMHESYNGDYVLYEDYEALQADYQRLQTECLAMSQVLAECRANDRQAMYYLNQVREIVGGDDFPDMVERCRELQAECERLQAESPKKVLFKFRNE